MISYIHLCGRLHVWTHGYTLHTFCNACLNVPILCADACASELSEGNKAKEEGMCDTSGHVEGVTALGKIAFFSKPETAIAKERALQRRGRRTGRGWTCRLVIFQHKHARSAASPASKKKSRILFHSLYALCITSLVNLSLDMCLHKLSFFMSTKKSSSLVIHCRQVTKSPSRPRSLVDQNDHIAIPTPRLAQDPHRDTTPVSWRAAFRNDVIGIS